MRSIAFIIPVYNEEARLEKTFQALASLRLPKGLTLSEVIFVDDGSTDKTVSRISYFASHMEKESKKSKIPDTKYQLRVISYPTNHGKGYAVRQGLARVSADYALLFDADISTPLTEIEKFVPVMEKGIDVIVGTRKNGHSTVITHQPLLRELLGKGFTLLTRLLLGVRVTDFTCGFKAFSGNAIEAIVPECRIDRWGYDAEILLLASQKGLRMREVPVVWSNDARTRVRLYRDIPETLWDLARIIWIHRLPFTSVLPMPSRMADEPITMR